MARKSGGVAFVDVVSQLPSDEAAALAAAIPALERLRALDNAQRDAMLRPRLAVVAVVPPFQGRHVTREIRADRCVSG